MVYPIALIEAYPKGTRAAIRLAGPNEYDADRPCGRTEHGWSEDVGELGFVYFSLLLRGGGRAL
eukprot:844869-Amorphochlora_amoeboformis.AAC.1